LTPQRRIEVENRTKLRNGDRLRGVSSRTEGKDWALDAKFRREHDLTVPALMAARCVFSDKAYPVQ